MAKNEMVRWSAAVAVVIALVYALVYIPTPYIVYKPGLAEDVGPMVHVEGADVGEDSVLMLTTVRQMYPNWASFVYARFNPNWEIYKKSDIFRKGETREDYVERQQFIMLSSQSNAIQAAYRVAKVPFELSYEGVVVLQTVRGMPAAGKLLPGDLIKGINGVQITKSEQVLNQLAEAKVGDRVKVLYERDKKEREIQLTIGDFSTLPEAPAEHKTAGPRPGLGIQPADLLAVKASDPKRQVDIKVEDIGGPSAGLMFALEIYDQLTPGDLTKGYRIAGTGEIFPDGQVDAIGGVKHKVSAADREKAEIFFAPQANAKDAASKAEQIGTDMKVVPVKTMADALNYLERLPKHE